MKPKYDKEKWLSERKEKVNVAITNIMSLFRGGNIPKAIKEVTFPNFDVPANNWSLRNRLLMYFAGTSDARGIRQWGEAKRNVSRGSKAFYILAPQMYKKEEKTETGEVKEVVRLGGFKPIPVFQVEKTTGQELDYQKIKLPELPLLDVANKWGIVVKGVAFQGSVMGHYRHSNQTDNQIILATPEEKTFFHELSHASQDKLGILRKGKADKFNEVTAEFSALVLAEITGRNTTNSGATYDYIKSYIKEGDISNYLMKVLADIEKIVNNIIQESGIKGE